MGFSKATQIYKDNEGDEFLQGDHEFLQAESLKRGEAMTKNLQGDGGNRSTRRR